MSKIFNKVKGKVDELARREDEQLNCEYDFISERDMLAKEKGFISTVDKNLINAYAIICAVFMIPDLIFMFFAPMSEAGTIIGDVFFAKALVFVLGFLGVKLHKYWLSIIAAVVALLNLAGGTDNKHTILKVIIKKLTNIEFESNIIFFFAILVVSVIAVAVTLKFIGVESHDNSTELSMREDKEAYNEYISRVEEQKKKLEAERTEAILNEAPEFSDDLGRAKLDKINYMDEI